MMKDYHVSQFLQDPSRIFASPKEVLTLSGLADAEKEAVLRSWQDQVVQLMRAGEENMERQRNGEPALADQLSEIVSALLELQMPEPNADDLN